MTQTRHEVSCSTASVANSSGMSSMHRLKWKREEEEEEEEEETMKRL
jgi:hypothetical protein